MVLAVHTNMVFWEGSRNCKERRVLRMLSLRDLVQFWTPYMSCFFDHKLEANSIRPKKLLNFSHPYCNIIGDQLEVDNDRPTEQLLFSHGKQDIIGHQLGETTIDQQCNYISAINISALLVTILMLTKIGRQCSNMSLIHNATLLVTHLKLIAKDW